MRSRLALLVLALTACSPKQGQTEAPVPDGGRGSADTAPAPTLVESPEVQITLVDPGAEPRQVLRYSVPAGTTQPLRMVMDMKMGMTMGGATMMDMVMPPVVMTMDMAVPELGPAGELHILSELTAVEVQDSADATPGLAGSLQASMSGLVGMTTDSWLTPQGVTTAASVALPPGAMPEVQAQAAGMQQNLGSQSLPFPAEAVGIGGVWEVRSRTSNNGLVVDEVKRVTLAEQSGNLVVLDIDIAQTLADPNMVPPGLPPGTEVTIRRFESQGSGRTAIRLDHLVPDAGQSEVAMQMEFDVVAEGATQPFAMDMSIAIGITPGP